MGEGRKPEYGLFLVTSVYDGGGGPASRSGVSSSFIQAGRGLSGSREDSEGEFLSLLCEGWTAASLSFAEGDAVFGCSEESGAGVSS